MEGLKVSFFENNKSIIWGLPHWRFILLSSLFINATYALILLYYFGFNYLFPSPIIYPDYYHILAKNLLAGKGYVIGHGEDFVFWRPPLYPLFLASIYYFFGYQHFPVVLIQIILNSLTAVLIYRVVRKIFSPPLGLSSGILYSLYPLTAYYLIRVSTVILFNFLLILLIMTMYQFYDTPNRRHATIFGAMQGLLTLCQLFFEGFLIFVLLTIFIATLFCFRKGVKKQIQLSLWMILGFSIVMAPWVIRNYKLSGVFPVIGAGGGFTIWFGNRIQTDGKDFDQLNPKEVQGLNEELQWIIGEGNPMDLRNDKKLYQEAIRNFIHYPKETITLLFKKMFRLWFSVYSLQMQKYQRIVSVIQSIIIFPGILGIYLALKKGIRIAPLLLLIIYFQVVYTFFNGTIRYSLPMMPIIISLAVYGIVETYWGLPIHTMRGDYGHC